MKGIFQLNLLLLLALFATGCCTSALLDKYHETTSDRFTPLAVYSTTNYDKFALEGKIEYASGKPPVQTFMILPQNSSTIASLQAAIDYRTKMGIEADHVEAGLKVILFRALQQLPASVSIKMVQTNGLPPIYNKMSDVYPNIDRPAETVDGCNYYSGKEKFGIKEHHPSRGVIVFIPFTATVDVVTAPVQIPFILLIGWAMGHSHGC